MANTELVADTGLGGGSPRREARVIGPLAVALALVSALATFLVLSGLTSIIPTHDVVVTLLLINTATVLLLLAIVGREVWHIVQARRRGRAAARLHVRIIALFSIVAVVPAVLVAVVASITLDRGLDRLFSSQTRTVIENSLIVTEAYVREHAQLLRNDTVGLAIEISRAKPLFERDRGWFRQVLTGQATERRLPAAQIIDGNLNVLERAETQFDGDLPLPSTEVLSAITDNEPQMAVLLDANLVAAVVKLVDYDNTYLYAARPLDPQVVAQLRATRTSIEEYAALEARRVGVQIAFALMYTVIALSVLLSAVWIGLNFANYLVAPIRRLIGAAQLVSTGNLLVQVPIRRSEGDLAQLGESFNKMTGELRSQRDDLLRARDTIDSRRRFTEAVLSGASAGVIGVDSNGNISILNPSAEKLVDCTEAEALGRPLVDVVPELADIMDAARIGAQRLAQTQIDISRKGRGRNLSVRVTSEQAAEHDHGYVITLDDITELVSAQRTSAWADVARRIAHEIKNPLTPIQLSAERLRRKYGSVITDDRAVFEQCTDTIVRQVDDIKRMVDEFSRFARMPKPVMAEEDVADTVRQAVFLMKVAHSDINIEVDLKEDPMPAQFDRRLVSQALTNVIKNAAEAIAAAGHGEQGRIHITAFRQHGEIVIDVVDNGIGFPKQNRSRLVEPYVTTRDKGTGLGLAIVSRIIEDHGGRLELGDAADLTPGARGAWMRLRFAARPSATAANIPDNLAAAAGQ
jgi:two-component system nitrogen regulation sensor histidine kinase NtrY